MISAILSDLLKASDRIFDNLGRANLARYDRLQKDLLITNVAENRDYQRTFNGYYRVQRRPPGFYQSFYGFLEQQKRNENISFTEALIHIHRNTGQLEASFCSKLVATIRPEKPIYDSVVRKNLELRVPRTNLSLDERVKRLEEMYNSLEMRVFALVQDQQFHDLKIRFDNELPAYRHFTDVKKIDLMLWQHRNLS